MAIRTEKRGLVKALTLPELIIELFFRTLFRILLGIVFAFVLWAVLAKIIGQEGNFNLAFSPVASPSASFCQCGGRCRCSRDGRIRARFRRGITKLRHLGLTPKAKATRRGAGRLPVDLDGENVARQSNWNEKRPAMRAFSIAGARYERVPATAFNIEEVRRL